MDILNKTAESLRKNNFDVIILESKSEVVGTVENIIIPGTTVSVGGSVTLSECGIMDLLRSGEYNFIDRDTAQTPEERNECYRRSFFADYFLCSSNAVTEDGKLYNTDGTGNRVAAMIYGPTNVIVVAGKNKIVPDAAAAENRVKTLVAPKNANRLNLPTYCSKTGHCAECDGKDCADVRICCDYSVIGYQNTKRITVILVNEELGY